MPESTIRRSVQRLRDGYRRIVLPTALGLPNWRVLTWFPILAAAGSLVLIVLGWSGTSSGAHWFSLGIGDDPRLILGTPRGIRSDEWLVQQGWVVSQSYRGYPSTNEMFPGGTDMTVLNELPSWDWSSVFRPHLWGYLFFGLTSGMAWHWWIPALALVSACYVFVVTLLPRRPLTAAFLAVALFFTPFLQWWFTPSSLWSAAWPLLAMAGTVWILVDTRRWTRFLWAGIVGYTAVTLVMGLYVPYILPGLFAYLAFAIGYLLMVAPWRHGGFRATWLRLAPLVVAGVAALGVTLVWVITRIGTFGAIMSTVYPGQRSEPTGSVFLKDPFLLGILGAPWNQALKGESGTTVLGLNSSEGSSVLLLSVFLLPGLLVLALATLRRGRRTDWVALCVLAYFAIALAYLFVPGWDAIAHVLQFDRVPPERFRILFVVLAPIIAVLTIKRVDSASGKRAWLLGLLSASGAGLLIGYAWYRIKTLQPELFALAPTWKVIAVLVVVATALFFVRRGVTVAAACIALATVLIGWGVNPIYRGVFDLRATTAGQTIDSIDDADPGVWVGVGSHEAMALLMESDVESLSGVQTYPSREMWELVDPQDRFEEQWNRLGHVQWNFAPGEPTIQNPQPDVIAVTFDPCSTFAQENVDYVASVVVPESSSCLVERAFVQQGQLPLHIYEVVPR
ncbi:DUF7657 domain-containing protein [Luethyella okanaganae]|uniref:Glycosyltransferase RgtA/B/C/D-like domain-containing protein n=1 Tax=Luethyella okanaganae TaxID=69372 RepID=A0ABW1VE15_9MICO